MNDSESGLYYLQSRYYDPKIGRFINADGLLTTTQDALGCNLFSYCGNNPVNRADTTGTIWRLLIAAVAVAFLYGCSNESLQEEPYSGYANCYAYALKLEYDPETGKPFSYEASPGCFSGTPLTTDDFGNGSITKQEFYSKMSADAEELGYSFREVYSADCATDAGSWLIALAYSETYGFHFYRRDEDGTWSYKQGQLDIYTKDYSGKIIMDPQTCNRGGYTEFFGYYQVGPSGG